jgi:hypothetical protein
MSSPLAIAAVTAVLLDLLNDGMIDHDLSAVGSVKVTASPPDRVTTGASEPNQLNLFLYQVTPNLGWRNNALPSHDARGTRLTNPPLALNLHYLLTAYGSEDLNSEILLGYGMELLHDLRTLPREAIRRSLAADVVKASLIPKDDQDRFAADLADQIEQIKITPHYLNADELTKLWTAMQSRYRPTVAFEVSVVLIEGRRRVRSALPVLTQGSEDSGPVGRASLVPGFPTLIAAAVQDVHGRGRAAAQLGDTLRLSGFNLAGQTVTAQFQHPHLDAPFERPGVVDGDTISVALPSAADPESTDWLAGIYGLSLRIEQGGRESTTNELPLAIAPAIVSALPMIVARGGDGAAAVTVTSFPPVHPGQRASLLIGGDEYPASRIQVASDQIAVTIPNAEPTAHPLPIRLRVDGVETALVPDISARPPRYDPAQTVSIT